MKSKIQILPNPKQIQNPNDQATFGGNPKRADKGLGFYFNLW